MVRVVFTKGAIFILPSCMFVTCPCQAICQWADFHANIHVFVVPGRQVLRVDPDEDHVLPVGPDRHVRRVDPDRHVRRVDPDEDHVRPFDPVDPDDHVLPVDPDEGS